MNASQEATRPYLDRRIKEMAKDPGRCVDEARAWLEMMADKIEAGEHFDSLDDPPYVLCLNGRVVCNGLEAWDGDTFRLYFTDDPADRFPEGALEPREGGWVPEPGWVPARCVLREISAPPASARAVATADPVAAPINPLW